MAFTPPLPQESLGAHLERALGWSDFCVSINAVARWLPEWETELATSLVQPLGAPANHPGLGVDFYSFMGRYDRTPFGLHDDNDHTFLVHLGPEPKEVWLLDRAAMAQKSGGVSPAFVEALLDVADHLTLYPGDLLFIPWGHFHILGEAVSTEDVEVSPRDE